MSALNLAFFAPFDLSNVFVERLEFLLFLEGLLIFVGLDSSCGALDFSLEISCRIGLAR